MKYTSPTIVVPDKLLQIIVLDDDFFITNFATFVRENLLTNCCFGQLFKLFFPGRGGRVVRVIKMVRVVRVVGILGGRDD